MNARNDSAERSSIESDALLQVALEIEGLRKLGDLVPDDLLWDRPPGLPSGAELLWLIHLVDRHVFAPAARTLSPAEEIAIAPPDYVRLLTAYPCSAQTLEELHGDVAASRKLVIEEIQNGADSTRQAAQALIKTILEHDRQLLAAFTERLYESGFGT